MVVSGGTGSGKTTMLNALSEMIPEKERLITIEDAAELQLQQPHVGRLETRPPNTEGSGEIRQRELVKNALRMRPDRIIVGEVRGEEAFDMLQAMNTGHEGSMTTIHANSSARCARAPRADDRHGRHSRCRQRRSAPRSSSAITSCAGPAPVRRQARVTSDQRDHRHGGRGHPDAGDLPLREGIDRRRRHDPRPPRGDGHPAHVPQRAATMGVNLPGSNFDPGQPL
jgi:hypothetical protein